MEKVAIECYAVSDPGQVRKTNEDQYLIADLRKSLMIHQTSLSRQDHSRLIGDPQGRLLVVADGMGGKGGGRTASPWPWTPSSSTCSTSCPGSFAWTKPTRASSAAS